MQSVVEPVWVGGSGSNKTFNSVYSDQGVFKMVKVQNDNKFPSPRLCLLRRWPNFDGGFGFKLYEDLISSTGELKVEEVVQHSPAEAGGLRKNDVIIEINGHNIEFKSFFRLVEVLKEACSRNKMELLVLAEQDAEWYRLRNITVNSHFPNIEYCETPYILEPIDSTTPVCLSDDQLADSGNCTMADRRSTPLTNPYSTLGKDNGERSVDTSLGDSQGTNAFTDSQQQQPDPDINTLKKGHIIKLHDPNMSSTMKRSRSNDDSTFSYLNSGCNGYQTASHFQRGSPYTQSLNRFTSSQPNLQSLTPVTRTQSQQSKLNTNQDTSRYKLRLNKAMLQPGETPSYVSTYESTYVKHSINVIYDNSHDANNVTSTSDVKQKPEQPYKPDEIKFTYSTSIPTVSAQKQQKIEQAEREECERLERLEREQIQREKEEAERRERERREREKRKRKEREERERLERLTSKPAPSADKDALAALTTILVNCSSTEKLNDATEIPIVKSEIVYKQQPIPLVNESKITSQQPEFFKKNFKLKLFHLHI